MISKLKKDTLVLKARRNVRYVINSEKEISPTDAKCRVE
jgi:hypothetical protein